ncbi:hypothetical protein C8R44DRAFT_872349 [Mycena epipterygia]|nr:hypothetical protein C8R44DRAFT_872349 [Mycena epipterygia]
MASYAPIPTPIIITRIRFPATTTLRRNTAPRSSRTISAPPTRVASHSRAHPSSWIRAPLRVKCIICHKRSFALPCLLCCAVAIFTTTCWKPPSRVNVPARAAHVYDEQDAHQLPAGPAVHGVTNGYDHPPYQSFSPTPINTVTVHPPSSICSLPPFFIELCTTPSKIPLEFKHRNNPESERYPAESRAPATTLRILVLCLQARMIQSPVSLDSFSAPSPPRQGLFSHRCTTSTSQMPRGFNIITTHSSEFQLPMERSRPTLNLSPRLQQHLPRLVLFRHLPDMAVSRYPNSARTFNTLS